MGIKISSVRVNGFRGIVNSEIELESSSTIITGMNNSGKTSFLKALQLVFGNRNFLSHDDFNVSGDVHATSIIVDVLIEPKNGDEFSSDWEILFTTDRIRLQNFTKSVVPLRTVVNFDPLKNAFKSEQYILPEWHAYQNEQGYWFEQEQGMKTNFHFDEIPFFYINAQRDILEDTRLKGSYLGKMLSKIEYSADDVAQIEAEIDNLNKKAVESSPILSSLKSTLKGLNSAMSTNGDGIELSPFTKKIRDLSKGMTIYYADAEESFSMEYHGMGTRSWSSLLTLKAFISLVASSAQEEGKVFFPIVAIEEPESHLHPNAQKKLYRQMSGISGQKIISTHSPYIAACAKLTQIRNFYKSQQLSVGSFHDIELTDEEIRKVNRQVINTRGEIFFSKCIVFFEGETEEQALPILFENRFTMSSVEAGIDFVGVGGYEGYIPFLTFAKQFNIPCVILSDADNEEIVAKVTAQYEKIFSGGDSPLSKLVFLEDGHDYERQIVADGYQDEIRKAILSLKVYHNEQHRLAAEPNEILAANQMDDQQLYEKMCSKKTQMAPAVAHQIAISGKPLPAKVVEIFDYVETVK